MSRPSLEQTLDRANSDVVLIVDDVPDNLAVLHDALDESGYTVLVATGGEAALQRAAQALPDIILLDAMMPGMDGFEVARHDLRRRGPGELLGARQSGVPLLRFADLSVDVDLLDAARDVAAALLVENPPAAHAHLQRWLGGRGEFLKV